MWFRRSIVDFFARLLRVVEEPRVTVCRLSVGTGMVPVYGTIKESVRVKHRDLGETTDWVVEWDRGYTSRVPSHSFVWHKGYRTLIER